MNNNFHLSIHPSIAHRLSGVLIHNNLFSHNYLLVKTTAAHPSVHPLVSISSLLIRFMGIDLTTIIGHHHTVAISVVATVTAPTLLNMSK